MSNLNFLFETGHNSVLAAGHNFWTDLICQIFQCADLVGNHFIFPVQRILTFRVGLQTARQCKDIGPLVKKGNLTPWQAMCLHLLFERACDEASFWHPYIALLPTELELMGTHPLLWSQVGIP